MMEKKRLPVDADLSHAALEDAVLALGRPRVTYTVTVHPDQVASAASLLKGIGADTKDNPLSPYINLALDESLKFYAWRLDDGTTEVHSEGA